MKIRKQQFLEVVRMLAADNALILNLAQRVAEADPPLFPGGAALEFVAGMHGLAGWATNPRSCADRQAGSTRRSRKHRKAPQGSENAALSFCE